MQIIERTKGPRNGLEIVSASESESNVQEEVNRRTHKAGYTDRDGQPRTNRATSYSKGDSRRPGNSQAYRENYVKIFGHE